MNLTSSKGLSTNVTYIVVAIIVTLGVVTAAGLFTASAGQQQAAQEGGNAYFEAVATQSVSQLESPWASGNDAQTINQVHYDSDGDQTSAGNVTFGVTNGTVDDTVTSYINLEVGGDTASPMTLQTEFDNTGAFTQDNTNLDVVRLRDYDKTSTVGSFDATALQTEESARVAGVGNGEYVLQVDFEFQSVNSADSTGTRDTIMTVTGTLESPNAPSDEPTEFEDFSYDTLTE